MAKTDKIVPHLWFDKDAKEAARFYTSIFKDSRVKSTTTLHDTPSGDADIITVDLMGQEFMLINAGPYFRFTPAISFMVAFGTSEGVDELWDRLVEGGSVLMPIGEYPFSSRYGWVQDKYGLSWQVIWYDGKEITQHITPALMFVGDQCGKAEEAMNFYVSVFHDAKIGDIARYGKAEATDREGTVIHATFTVEGHEFTAMDSGFNHGFSFTEAVSFIVKCETQGEIDYYWERLSAVPEAEQCGWLKDKYGLSWQIVPAAMDEFMARGTGEQIARVTAAFLQMKKFNIAGLERAFKGDPAGSRPSRKPTGDEQA